MIQASEDKKNRLIGFAMLTNLGVGCISRAVSVEGKKILRFEGRTNRQTDKQTPRPETIWVLIMRSGTIIISIINYVFVTLMDFRRRYGVHYRLQSTCVGSFTCPGIDTQVQGTTAFSPIRRTLLNVLHNIRVLARDRTHAWPLTDWFSSQSR